MTAAAVSKLCVAEGLWGARIRLGAQYIAFMRLLRITHHTCTALPAAARLVASCSPVRLGAFCGDSRLSICVPVVGYSKASSSEGRSHDDSTLRSPPEWSAWASAAVGCG